MHAFIHAHRSVQTRIKIAFCITFTMYVRLDFYKKILAFVNANTYRKSMKLTNKSRNLSF